MREKAREGENVRMRGMKSERTCVSVNERGREKGRESSEYAGKTKKAKKEQRQNAGKTSENRGHTLQGTQLFGTGVSQFRSRDILACIESRWRAIATKRWQAQ